jgi:hypothetical protein
LILEARSPFSARFQPIEISCPQISVRWSPLRNRRILTLWRLTRCCVRCRREPKAQSWPRSYIRWSRWLDHFFTAAKLLRGVGAGGLELDLLKAEASRDLRRGAHSVSVMRQAWRCAWHAKLPPIFGRVFRASKLRCNRQPTSHRRSSPLPRGSRLTRPDTSDRSHSMSAHVHS